MSLQPRESGSLRHLGCASGDIATPGKRCSENTGSYPNYLDTETTGKRHPFWQKHAAWSSIKGTAWPSRSTFHVMPAGPLTRLGSARLITLANRMAGIATVAIPSRVFRRNTWIVPRHAAHGQFTTRTSFHRITEKLKNPWRLSPTIRISEKFISHVSGFAARNRQQRAAGKSSVPCV